MPTKRLVPFQPATDGATSFPYLDVRLAFAGTFGLAKAGAQINGDFIVSPFTAELRLRFYRLVGGSRIFLAKDYRPVERIFQAKQRIREPEDDTASTSILFFWNYLYIGTVPSLAAQYGVNMDHLRDQVGVENPFEALDINAPINYFPMINCLRVLLEQEGGPDFAGLTVVEDAA